MVRKLALALVLLPTLGIPQGGLIKSQEKRTKALDAAATTPFFTKRGAEDVRKVVAGADRQKQDEKATDPFDGKRADPRGVTNPQSPIVPPQEGQNPPVAQKPAPDPVFAWRLVGISYGKRQGMALFEGSGKDISVQSGSQLDSETKIVSITSKQVTLTFRGKRLALTPW